MVAGELRLLIIANQTDRRPDPERRTWPVCDGAVGKAGTVVLESG